MTDSFQQFTLSLQQSELSLKEILTHKQLPQALSSSYHPLFQFVVQNETMIELLEWCLSTKHINEDRFTPTSNAAMSIILAAISKQSHFLTTKFIQDYLLNFLKSDDSKNDHLVGYFSSLFLPSKFDKYNQFDSFAEFFQISEDLPSLLISRIDSYAMQQLIIEFVSSDQYVNQSFLLINELRSILTVSDSACHTISAIYKQLSKQSSLFSQISTLYFLDSLIEAFFCMESSFTQFELASTVSDLLHLFPSLILSLSDSQIRLCKLTADNITTLSIQCIDAFYHSNSEAFQFFFLDERIHHKLMQRFQFISNDQLFSVAKIPDFVNTLIDMYENGQWCPHCLKIAVEFGAMNYKPDELLEKRWCDFYDENIAKKLDILNNEFGGPIPVLSEAKSIEFMKMYRDPFAKFSPSIRTPITPISQKIPETNYNKNFISSSIYSTSGQSSYNNVEAGEEDPYFEEDSGSLFEDDSEEYVIDI